MAIYLSVDLRDYIVISRLSTKLPLKILKTPNMMRPVS